MSEHEHPEIQWERGEEESFHVLEEAMDQAAAPLLARPDRYGGFRLAARRDVVEPKHKMVRWEYLWEDEQKSSHTVALFYDGLQKKFYIYVSGARTFFNDVDGAIEHVRSQIEEVKRKHER